MAQQVDEEDPNPIMNALTLIIITRFEHLIEKCFLNPEHLNKMRNDSAEILSFIRQNHDIVSDQLYRLTSPTSKETGTHGIWNSVNIIESMSQQLQTWDICIVRRSVFIAISEALRKNCIASQNEESNTLLQMEEMNAEMKNLRHALDKYFLEYEPDVLFEKEETMIRQKFHNIQSKLLVISNKQNAIHDKLRILQRVEQKMIDLQNVYDKELGQLHKNGEDVLRDLLNNSEFDKVLDNCQKSTLLIQGYHRENTYLEIPKSIMHITFTFYHLVVSF